MEHNNNNLHANNGGMGRLDAAVLHQLQANVVWYRLLGIALIVLGSLAVLFSFYSTVISIIYLGAFLILIGFFEGIKAFKVSKWSTFLLHLLLAALYIIGGVFLISNPALNALTLTWLLAAFFIGAGLAKIFFALRKEVVHKGWLVANGILGIVLGLLIWQQWPYSGLWVIGTIVGIDAIMTGFTWIMLASSVKRLMPAGHNQQHKMY